MEKNTIAGILILTVLLGCGGGASDNKDRVYEIALVPKMLDNTVFNYARIGAEAKARELGNVRIRWDAPQTGDAARQARIVDELVASGVDGIAVSCNEPQALLGPINRAIAKGIPTITFDSDSPTSKRTTFYGVNDYECGQMLGKALIELTGGKGEYAVLSGVPGAFNLEERMRGAKEVLEQAEGMKEYQTVYCNDDLRLAVTKIQGVMQQKPDLAGWVMVGGWPLFLQGALDGVDPRKTKVAAVDALPPVWPYIESGKVQYVLSQKVYGWGYESVQILYNLIRGTGEYESFTDSGVDVVTPETLDDYKTKWAQWFGEKDN